MDTAAECIAALASHPEWLPGPGPSERRYDPAEASPEFNLATRPDNYLKVPLRGPRRHREGTLRWGSAPMKPLPRPPLTTVKFTDLPPRDEVLALGLPAPRLALVLGGLVGTVSVLHLAWPEPLRLSATGGLDGLVAALAWAQFGGLPLSAWALRVIGLWRRRCSCARGPEHTWSPIDGITEPN